MSWPVCVVLAVECGQGVYRFGVDRGALLWTRRLALLGHSLMVLLYLLGWVVVVRNGHSYM